METQDNLGNNLSNECMDSLWDNLVVDMEDNLYEIFPSNLWRGLNTWGTLEDDIKWCFI